MWKKLGIIRIEQSTPEVVQEMRSLINHEVEITQVGALDDKTLDSIPESKGNYPSLVRINGVETTVDTEEYIFPLVQDLVDKLEEEGTEANIIFSSTKFPSFSHEHPLFVPWHLLKNLFPTLGLNKVGLVSPCKEQEEANHAKWSKIGIDTEIVTISPGEDREETIQSTLKPLNHTPIELLVFDCMGFGNRFSKVAQECVNIPVVTVRGLIYGFFINFVRNGMYK